MQSIKLHSIYSCISSLVSSALGLKNRKLYKVLYILSHWEEIGYVEPFYSQCVQNYFPHSTC